MSQRTVIRSAIVPFSRALMFDLVADVCAYPEFLSGCTRATVQTCSASEVIATLYFSKLGIQKSFTTKNTLKSPESIHLQLVEGPFKHLQGEWRFKALSSAGCEIHLELIYETQSGFLEKAFGMMFDPLANHLVESFCDRARTLYAR